jgi:tetratricopeptide (TPR) repeat protein
MNALRATKARLLASFLLAATAVACHRDLARAADAKPLTVAIAFAQTDEKPAIYPRTIARMFRHAALSAARGKLVDVTRWRPGGAGADALVTARVRRDRIDLSVTRPSRNDTAGELGRSRLEFSATGGEGHLALALKAAAGLVEHLAGASPPGAQAAPLPDAALAEFERGLAVTGNTADALIERRAHFANAVSSAPDWALARLELGKAAAAQGDGKGATDHLLKACELNPDDAEARAELALAYRCAGRLAEAVSNYTAALALAPGDPLIHNNFGAALLAAGETEAAVRHFDAAARLEPLYPDPLVNLGTALRATGREKEAENHYRRAVQMAPNEPGPRIALAALLSDAGEHRGAQEQLEAAVAANPNHAPARFQLALVLATRQKYSDAIENLKTVLRLAPGYREARYNLGLCYHYTGRDDDAIKTFEDGVKREPDYAWHYYGLGLVYEAKEQNELAEAALKMALEKDPALVPAQIALNRIHGEGPKPQLAWPFGLWCGGAKKGTADGAGTAASFVPSAITLGALILPAALVRRRRKNREK